jgi:L-threonylcarbamoyladenylate synthase
MLASHYAPQAQVEVVPRGELLARARQLGEQGERVCVLLSGSDDRAALGALRGVSLLELGANDASAAQRLYAAMRQADVDGARVVLVSAPVAQGLGEALADRLTKAAGPRHS